MNQSTHLPFRLFTISVFIALICPILIQDGMFMDGQQYACVAKNLSNGIGTFWFPILSQTWWKANSNFFMEHPPLIYGIQSFFFTLLGESMYVERIYSLITAILTAFLLSKIWKLTCNENKELSKFGWLPILLWIIIPVCFWSYQNNMQENTMGVFTIASVFFSLKAIRENGTKTSLISILLAGVAIFMATFSKGLPGLFPLGIVVLYRLTHRDISISRTTLYSFILILLPVIIYSLLFLNPTAFESLKFYVNERLLQRINNEPVVTNHFYIVYKLLIELLVPITIGAIILIISKVKNPTINYNHKNRNFSQLFLFIGLSGSLPLAFTPVQRGFYLLPALPFFALAIAHYIVPALHALFQSLDSNKIILRKLMRISIMVLSGVLVYTFLQIGKSGRDKDMLSDVYRLGSVIKKGSIADTDPTIYEQWNFQFYLLRYFDISLNPSLKYHFYYITTKNSSLPILEHYQKVSMDTKVYDLYRGGK